MIGKTISHYTILEKIGGGGMGVVYKAEDTKLKRTVALKFLPPAFATDPTTKERFIHEAQSASALEHPNICNIHEIDESEDGQLFISMAYYEGETLQKRIKDERLKIKEAIEYAIQIAQGLKEAHDRGLVHRDIKPANIIITEKNEAKILDFGLAKFRGQTKITKEGSTLGTVSYMSPEQILSGSIDARADIWSLGVVLYEMVTQEVPFIGDIDQAVVYAILKNKPKPLSTLRQDIPRGLEKIVNKSLEKDPKKRYQNMAEMLVDLESLLKEDSIALTKPRPALIQLLSRKKAYLYGIAAVLLAILVLFLGSWYVSPDHQDGKLIIVIPQENSRDEVEPEWFTEGMADVLISNLAMVSGLRIIHRSTAMKYKGTMKTPSEIAAEIGIDYVVESRVVKVTDQVSISVQLSDARNDVYIWTNNYSGDFENILGLFGEIVREIASQIEAELTTEEKEQFATIKKVNPEAYELYLQGNLFLNTDKSKDIKKAADYFKRSIEIDSNYALSYVGLSNCYGLLTFYNVLSRDEGNAQVKKTINKALELNKNLAEIYYSQGAHRLWQLWDWQGAEEAFDQAMEINPNVTGILGAEYLWYLMIMGRSKQAIVEAERRLELDPLSFVTRKAVGYAYSFAGQFDKAIELYQRTVELNPEDPRPYSQLAENYYLMGKYDKAHENRLSALHLSGETPEMIATYDSLYSELGPKAWPTVVLRRRKEKDGLKKYPSWTAGIYTRLGETQKALDWLEIAYEKHDGGLTTINVNPGQHPLRGEPRFQAILKRMDFPD